MRNIFVILLLIIASKLYGQTDSIEMAIIKNRFLHKEITQEEFSEIGFNWIQTILKVKKYPDLPLDQNGQVHYAFVVSFKDIGKEKLFSRTLEWLSINFGMFPSYLYSNAEDGKIILSNSFNINNSYSSNYKCVISIKSEKLLMEFINIGYQVYREGHYSGDTWVEEKTTSFDISQVFPVVLKKSSEWEFDLNLFKATNDYFNNEVHSLNDFIMNYDSNYSF